jgi:hypothetical protein
MRIRWAALSFVCAISFGATPIASTHFRNGDQGRIEVDVKVNGRGPFAFFFDTGSMTIISLDLARELGVDVTGRQRIQAFGGPVETGSAIVNSLNVGDLTMGRSQVTVIDGGPFNKHGSVGVLGRELLNRLITQVNYEQGTLEFFDPTGFVYTGKGRRLPLTAHSNELMTTRMRVFGAEASIQVDSGAENSLGLFPKFVREHGLKPGEPAITGYGFGGLTHAGVTRALELNLGGFAIRNVVVFLSTDTDAIESGPADGNMGGQLMREFTWTFDLPHESLFVEPNSWYEKPALEDASGLVLDSRADPVKVLFVFPGSPAARAGIFKGDSVRDPNDKALTGEQWHDLLDSPGTVIHLLVEHNGRWTPVSLMLRKYL